MRSHVSTLIPCALAATMMLAVGSPTFAQSRYATQVIDYDPGSTPVAGYTDSSTALGTPERMTGEGTPYLGAVTMFNAPWGTDEVVSIGEDGYITLTFDRPITNDPSHLYGQDFILFANAGFIDTDYPNGLIGGVFGNDDALVEVSADGSDWRTVSHNLADGLFPMQAYRDVGPFDTSPGLVPTNFLKPMNPSLTYADFAGLDYADALAFYGLSGGGTPIDIAATGLTSVEYVRITVLDDGDSGTGLNFELDAISVVPEPATAGMLVAGLILTCRRRRPFVSLRPWLEI